MTEPRPAVIGGVDVDAVAASVIACSTVARLSGGLLGEAATYLPGRRVYGVVVREHPAPDETDLDVRVVAVFGPTMSEVADQVHQAVALVAPGRSVTVAIDDVDLGGAVDAAG